MRKLTACGLSGLVLAFGVAALTTAAPASGRTAAKASATKKKSKKITCRLALNAIVPQPAPTAANFGTAKCSKPFGTGVQQDSSKVTRTSLLTGDFTGPFKLFFNTGTIRGMFSIAFKTSLNAAYKIIGVTYTGTLKVTGATGKFVGVRGKGTVTGVSPDAVKTALTEKLTLTGL